MTTRRRVSCKRKAFWDGMHQKVSTPNRRRGHPNVTVWEIHPVQRMQVVDEGNDSD
jgi:hypothetical protein